MAAISPMNRVFVNIGTTGPGTVTFGAVVTSAFLRPVDAGGVSGQKVRYCLEEGSDFEIGLGTLGSGALTMTRDTVEVSKIGGAVGTSKMTLAGAATLRGVYSGADYAALAITIGKILSISNTLTLAGTDGSTLNIGAGGTLAPPAFGIGTAPCGFRLTLTTGVPITESDVIGATTVYATPTAGNMLPIYNGTSFIQFFSAELSLALDSNSGHTQYHQSGKNFDFYAALNGGSPVLGTSPDWTAGAGAGSDTARGTGAGSTELQMVNGVWTNKNTITLRIGANSGDTISVAANQATFLGSARMTANGTTEDSRVKRLLSNVFNRRLRPMLRAEATGNSWAYSTAVWRQANANAANQLAFLNCLAGVRATARVSVSVVSSVGTFQGYSYIGIGLDSSTVNSAELSSYRFETGSGSMPTAEYDDFPGLGYHELRWLEYFLVTAGSGTMTWFASGATDGRYKSGILGETEA